MNQHELELLRQEKQQYFLPFYCEIVNRHPLGVEAADVKETTRQEIIQRFDFDPFDDVLTGINPSTGESAASQWANNLVSNKVLDREDMLVARGGRRVMLYPLDEDNSLPGEQPPPVGVELDESLRAAADSRRPSSTTVESTHYLRSAALAEYVRERSNHLCIVGSESCVTFMGKDGHPYVEVHHLIPMAEQHRTAINLDQTANMVAICPACHLKLHRGDRPSAEGTLLFVLSAYEASRSASFEDALAQCDLSRNIDSLLGYYGAR